MATQVAFVVKTNGIDIGRIIMLDTKVTHRGSYSPRRHGRMLDSILMAVLGTCCVLGCGQASELDRKPVFGKLIGAEGKRGVVTFTPVNTSIGPAATNEFEDGSYRFNSTDGPVPGAYNVSLELEVSMNAADMPKHLRGSKPPSAVYEPVEKVIAVSIPAEGPFEIDLVLNE